jgi:hypothetical protein
MYTSRNTPFCTSREKKLKTYRFLLFEHALFNWTFRTGERGAARTGFAARGGKGTLAHISPSEQRLK